MNILPSKFRKVLTSNHRLSVEASRFLDIPLNERRCTLCNTNQKADEMHFVLECNAPLCIRQKYLEPRFCERPNTFQLYELMSLLNLKN